jgi:sulfate permease, SulP family
MPFPETLVLLATVIVTVTTGNLALGVTGGVLLAMVLFARRVAHVIRVERIPGDDGASVRYEVHGPLFFGSSNDLVERFVYAIDPKQITIDLAHAQIWDASTVATLDSIEMRYKARGSDVTLTGMDQRSVALHERLTGQLA